MNPEIPTPTAERDENDDKLICPKCGGNDFLYDQPTVGQVTYQVLGLKHDGQLILDYDGEAQEPYAEGAGTLHCASCRHDMLLPEGVKVNLT